MVNTGRRKRNSEILTMLLEKADVQGYLTTEDLVEIYPDIRGDVDYLDSIVLALRRRGVEFLDPDSISPYEEESEELTPSDLDPFADLTPISSDDTIGLYLKEMSRVPLLSVEEELNLAQRIEAEHRHDQPARECDRESGAEARGITTPLVGAPGPAERLRQDITRVQRNLDGCAETPHAEGCSKQHDGPVVKGRDEHQCGLLVRVHQDVPRRKHQRACDEHAHRNHAAEADPEVRGRAIHPQLTLGELFFNRPGRVEVQKVRAHGRAQDAHGKKSVAEMMVRGERRQERRTQLSHVWAQPPGRQHERQRHQSEQTQAVFDDAEPAQPQDAPGGQADGEDPPHERNACEEPDGYRDAPDLRSNEQHIDE